jgi:hypothetical protein
MEPENDPQLRELLKEWQVPGAPRSLDECVLGLPQPASHGPWWRILLTGSIRVPVPVGIAIAAVVLAMAMVLFRERTPAPLPASISQSVSLVEFTPVTDVNVRVIRKHESN